MIEEDVSASRDGDLSRATLPGEFRGTHPGKEPPDLHFIFAYPIPDKTRIPDSSKKKRTMPAMLSGTDVRGMGNYLVLVCLLMVLAPGVAALEAPVVTGIIPAGGVNSSVLSITNLAGTSFASGATVSLVPAAIRPVHAGSLSASGIALLSSPRSVFVSGNYAYVASSGSNALEVVDISNPAMPVHRGSLSDGNNALLKLPYSVVVSGNYAYVASSGSNALEVVDVTNPSAPVHKGSLSAGGSTLLSNPRSVFVSGNYAYIASFGNNALEVVNISNPAKPVHAGSITDGGGAFLKQPTSVFVSGNYAYVAGSGSNGLEIIDISNPASPVHAGSISNDYLVKPDSVFVSGTYAYVTSSGSNALEIVDVTNPAAPVHAGCISNYYLTGAQSVHVSGRYAYVTSPAINTLEIVDVSDPANPVHAGIVQDGTGMPPFLKSPSAVFVSGNYACVTNMLGPALEILDLGSITATGVTVVSAIRITCLVDLRSRSPGVYDVVVTNPDGKSGMLSGGFTVNDEDAPTAGFYGTPLSGQAPLTVTFTDSSTRSPVSWNWSFGDGSLSNIQHPSHTFTRGGAYTVSLKVANAGGTSTLTRPCYIIVNGETTGIFRASSGMWYMDFTTDGIVDKTFHFGAQGDVPVVADWNGDGTPDAGVYRPTVGNWYVNYYQDSIPDRSFHFGTKGDIPLSGDWDGNGVADAGVFRPSNGNWYLDTTKTGVVNRTFHFGTIGDIPLSGDWDGNGVSDAGVFRPSNGNWYLNYNADGVVDKAVHFGTTGDIPLPGAWRSTSRVGPVAAFVAYPTSGKSPLEVQFTDQSSGTPASWRWSFGDGTSSTKKNPQHSYRSKQAGSYTVTLTVSNAVGTHAVTKIGYITIVS